MTVYLSDLISADRFKELIREGYISERAHEDDPNLRVYSYTPKTQYSGFWTVETRLARGLMLKVNSADYSDAEVVGRGLPKFFTIEQVGSDWGRPKLVDDDEEVVVEEAAELSWDVPAFVADKLNGALGLLYVAPDGLSISTKGSFGSTEAKIATRLLREKLSSKQQLELAELLEGKTPLFEIITPERPHPVDYGELEDIILLGIVEHGDGRWTPASSEETLVKRYGFSVAPKLPYVTLKEAVEAPYRENTEGLVVTLEDNSGQHLYKVKPKEYLELRRAFYATETVDLAALMSNLSSAELEELTDENEIPLPKGLRNQELHRAKLKSELITPLQEELRRVRSEYERLRGAAELPSRGDFARAASKSEIISGLLFMAYDEELTGQKRLASAVLKGLLKNTKKLNG